MSRFGILFMLFHYIILPIILFSEELYSLFERLFSQEQLNAPRNALDGYAVAGGGVLHACV